MGRMKMGMGIALLVIGCVTALTTVANAGTETEVSAQVRLRYEGSDRSFMPDVSMSHGVYQRARVRLDMEHDGGARGVVEIQDSRMWGDEGNTTNDTMNTDLSQGYLSLDVKQVDGLSVSMGRQEWSYGRERVIGGLDWDNSGRSFDGVKVHQKIGAHWFDLGMAKISEDMSAPTMMDENLVLAVLHVNVPDANFDIEPFVLYKEIQDARTYTTAVGNYASLKSGRFWIGEDFVFQKNQIRGADVDGYLFAVDAALDFSGEADGSFGGSAGYGIYSGDDATDDNDAAYDQLYPTGHKFHGYMDIAQPFADGMGVGLKDLHGKIWIKTDRGLKIVAAGHSFKSDVEVVGVDGDGNDIGQEFNVVFAGKHESGAAVQVGGGYFMAGDLMDAALGESAENALWAYVQTTVDF